MAWMTRIMWNDDSTTLIKETDEDTARARFTELSDSLKNPASYIAYVHMIDDGEVVASAGAGLVYDINVARRLAVWEDEERNTRARIGANPVLAQARAAADRAVARLDALAAEEMRS